MTPSDLNHAVHRPLSLHTPILSGPDVRALQGQINERYEHFEIDRRIKVDGELGGQTFDAATEIALCLGVCGEAQEKLRSGRISEGTQKLIRGRKRTDEEEAAGRRREDYRQKLRRRHSRTAGELAVQRGRELIGITERPPGSNLGPGNITVWQQFTGYTYVDDSDAQGVFWCGCFACWVVVKLGGAQIPNRQRLGFAPFITADALAGVNGLRAIPASEARPGDIACLWGGKHIEVVAERPSGGSVALLGGNTSKGGQDNNGGGVYENVRPVVDIDRGIVARPDWS